MVRLHSYGDDITFLGFDEYIRKTFAKTMSSLRSFDEFIQFLAGAIPKENLYRNLFLARGFLVCLSIVKAGHERFILDRHSWNHGGPAQLFDTFCSHANIECSVIKGYNKASGYKVGDTSVNGRHEWCAFKERNQWHLFDPNWCVTCTTASYGDEIMLEGNGEMCLVHSKQSEGAFMTRFDDDWFCTSPDIFLIHHFPDKSKWQLRECPLTLTEWLDLPFLETQFFKFNLQLLSESASRLKSKNGKCIIQIMAEEKMAKQLAFSSYLYMSTSRHSKISTEDWPLLVLSGRDKNVFIFEIRLPLVGTYRFEILFYYRDETPVYCCEFSIICDEADKNCKKLPIDTGIGYGYGTIAEEGGLSRPSVSGPRLFTQDQEKILTFKVDKDAMVELEYGSVVYADGKEISSVQQVDESRRLLKFKTNKPPEDDSEYALMIGKRPKNSNADFEPLLYYLVSSEEDSSYRDVMENAKSQRLEKRKENKLEEKQQKQASLKTRKEQLNEAIANLL